MSLDQLLHFSDQLYAQFSISCVCYSISYKHRPICCTHHYRSVINILRSVEPQLSISCTHKSPSGVRVIRSVVDVIRSVGQFSNGCVTYLISWMHSFRSIVRVIQSVVRSIFDQLRTFGRFLLQVTSHRSLFYQYRKYPKHL